MDKKIIKKTISILFLFYFFQFNLIGQNPVFIDNNEIDTILIKAHLGIYQFDKDGTTKGKKETIEIVFSKPDRKYIISNHVKEDYTVSYSTKKNEVTKTNRNKYLNKVVKNEILEVLIKSLNENGIHHLPILV